MKDEFNNECPYDFKNILFTRTISDHYYHNAYTFSNGVDYAFTDGSLSKEASINCYNNIIKPRYNGGNRALELNFNVIMSSSTSSHIGFFDNIFEIDCYNNTFKYCTYTTQNIFKQGCNNNYFGSNIGQNQFGVYCSGNKMYSSVYYNTFGDYFTNSTFNSSFMYNIIENYCSTFFTNAYVGKCYFGASCSSIQFNRNVERCTFGPSINSLFSYKNLYDCYFNSAIFILNIGTSGDTVLSTVKNLYIDAGCKIIDLTFDPETDTSGTYYQHYHLHSGIEGTTTTHKVIQMVGNLNYTTDVYPVGSTTIEV